MHKIELVVYRLSFRFKDRSQLKIMKAMGGCRHLKTVRISFDNYFDAAVLKCIQRTKDLEIRLPPFKPSAEALVQLSQVLQPGQVSS